MRENIPVRCTYKTTFILFGYQYYATLWLAFRFPKAMIYRCSAPIPIAIGIDREVSTCRIQRCSAPIPIAIGIVRKASSCQTSGFSDEIGNLIIKEKP
jgi:hypothetical protein